MSNEDHVFQFSHDLHWLSIGFALLPKYIAGEYQYIGDSELLWSLKSMNLYMLQTFAKWRISDWPIPWGDGP